jgi:DNA-binding GntR family transcriptional regulator
MASKLHAPSLVELAVSEIRRLILAGRYRLGDRLVEERLSEELGISRPPVREALRLLERGGLVVSTPRRGTIVTPLTAADIEEILSFRMALDRLAAELGVPVEPRNQGRLLRLREAMAEITAAARAGDRTRLVLANFDFHLAFAALPAHRRLEETYRDLTFQLQLCMALNLEVRERIHGSLDENAVRHQRLLDLVESGNREAVQEEVARHESRTFLDALRRSVED